MRVVVGDLEEVERGEILAVEGGVPEVAGACFRARCPLCLPGRRRRAGRRSACAESVLSSTGTSSLEVGAAGHHGGQGHVVLADVEIQRGAELAQVGDAGRGPAALDDALVDRESDGAASTPTTAMTMINSTRVNARPHEELGAHQGGGRDWAHRRSSAALEVFLHLLDERGEVEFRRWRWRPCKRTAGPGRRRAGRACRRARAAALRPRVFSCRPGRARRSACVAPGSILLKDSMSCLKPEGSVASRNASCSAGVRDLKKSRVVSLALDLLAFVERQAVEHATPRSR